jgi:hypothetical protein
MNSTYLVIHGDAFAIRDRDPNEYLLNIVYGDPKVTTVVVVGLFVALLEYKNDTNARYTFDRMPSFGYGAGYMLDRVKALTEFGSWIYHYAPSRMHD